MKKLELNIIGLSYSQTQSGAYALVLGESKGKRRLPIIIGGFEAQAIAIELEKMTPSRPLTHDLFKSFAETFNVDLSEVIIYNLVEGIFYSKLVCTRGKEEFEIDARTSDAIALAVRFSCPIYTYEFILSTAGIILEEGSEGKGEEGGGAEADVLEMDEGNYNRFNLEELKRMLDEAIADEAYEKASLIRDAIKERKKSQG
ncbi:MAG: bifunctional nuclease family protein [Flavobacteriales bacterium]|nr:bifunctional nuclease family protein [Flavobacteriales bacterium]MCB9448438.1 bifunctional nuclease family protein [Flavobacteriales bacterium]